jgi:hypothetical protein
VVVFVRDISMRNCRYDPDSAVQLGSAGAR